MSNLRNIRQTVLVATALLSACAATDPATKAQSVPSNRGLGYYLSGQVALSSHDSDVAADDLLKAHEANPTNRDLTLQAFIAAITAGRKDAASLARQLPDNQIAQLLMFNADIRQRKWDSATRRLKTLPNRGLAEVLQPLLVAWTWQAQGKTSEALATLKPFVATRKFGGMFALHAGMIAEEAKLPADAAHFYQLVTPQYVQSNARVAQIIASWQARSGNLAAADATLSNLDILSVDLPIITPLLDNASKRRPAMTANDGIAEVYLSAATALRGQGANEVAVILLRLSLDMRPDLTSAKLMLADIEAVQRRNDAALRTLATIPSDDPWYGIVRTRRAVLYERAGDTDKAINTLEALQRAYPDSALPDLQLGDLYRLKSRYQDSIAAYSRAIARIKSPAQKDWPIFYNRGIVYERASQWNDAEKDFLHALELAPDQPSVLNYLGYTWADRGVHLDRARKMLEEAAVRRPNDGAIIDSLGWVMFRLGDLPGATKALVRAVELEPQDPTINSHLGDLYWALGRKTEARYQWSRALTLNPPADEVAKLESKLKPPSGDAVISGQ